MREMRLAVPSMPTTAPMPTAAAAPAAAMPAVPIPAAAIPSIATVPAVQCEGEVGLIVVIIVIRPVIGIRPIVVVPVIMGPVIVVIVTMNHRMVVMRAMMLARFDMGCGQNEYAERNERCCQNFHFQPPWMPDAEAALFIRASPDQ